MANVSSPVVRTNWPLRVQVVAIRGQASGMCQPRESALDTRCRSRSVFEPVVGRRRAAGSRAYFPGCRIHLEGGAGPGRSDRRMVQENMMAQFREQPVGFGRYSEQGPLADTSKFEVRGEREEGRRGRGEG